MKMFWGKITPQKVFNVNKHVICWKASGDKQNTRTAFNNRYQITRLKRKDKDLENSLHHNTINKHTDRNFSFSSTVFRHSLRLTITILIGFYYWKNTTLSKCLLDRVNHCRYNETGVWLDKERTFQRIFGTILGGFIAFGILSFVHDSTILGGLYYCDAFLAFHLHQLIIKLEPHS
jgi:uncharacterized membrane protein YccC